MKRFIPVALVGLATVGVVLIWASGGRWTNSAAGSVVQPESSAVQPESRADEEATSTEVHGQLAAPASEHSGAELTNALRAPAATPAGDPDRIMLIERKPLSAQGIALFDDRYKRASSDDLRVQRDALESYIHEETHETLVQRYRDGQYEVIGQGREYHCDDWDPLEVCKVIMSDDQILKVMLSEEEVPEIYELRREIYWLNRNMHRREAEERLARGSFSADAREDVPTDR
ncbi:MAG: hypothetical protein CMJ84_14985 [Planctomycetes bacterium]|jgi:hypothetical protein|nr:hypothetical protein [Planctomycetota bacterium]